MRPCMVYGVYVYLVYKDRYTSKAKDIVNLNKFKWGRDILLSVLNKIYKF